MFFEFLENVSWGAGALFLAIAAIMLTIFGIYIIRRLVNPKKLKPHHDVAAVVFTNLGVLYSVLLGFTVVNVQQRFDKIKEQTQVEASYLIELYRDSQIFSDNDRTKIREALLNYNMSVINDEWPNMVSGKTMSHPSTPLSTLWTAYYDVTLTSQKQIEWYSLSINKLNLLMNARINRLLGSQESLGTEMWTMLILGAFIIVSFIGFFALESMGSHLLMGSILAAATAFLLFLIYSLDTAFRGGTSIPPEAMENVLQAFKIVSL